MLSQSQKEDIENKAIIEQSKKKIEQNEKFIDSMEQLKQEEEKAKNNFNILTNQCIALQDNLNSIKSIINDFKSSINSDREDISNSLESATQKINNSAVSVNQTLSQEIANGINNEIKTFSNSVIQVVGSLEKLQNGLMDKVKEHETTLTQDIEKQKASFKSATKSLAIEYGFMFFIGIFCSLITALYCINYQFHNIFFLDTMLVSDIIKYCINLVIGIVIGAILRGLFERILSRR